MVALLDSGTQMKSTLEEMFGGTTHHRSQNGKKNMMNRITIATLAASAVVGFSSHAQSQPAWQTVTIPSLPAGTQLGAVWARTRNEAYVWASQIGRAHV